MPIISENAFGALDAILAVRTHAAPAARPSTGCSADLPALSRSLDEVLRGRRSVRRFAAGGLARTELLGVIRHAGTVLASWTGHAPLVPADFVVLAGTHGVTGLADGLHRCEFGQLSTMYPRNDDRLAGLRAHYAAAPALLFVCGPLTRADSGDYGHRLVGAGAMGHALWLSALSSGLDGTVYGSSAALVTAAAHRLRPGLRHLFTVAIGRAEGSDE
jgi:hypothetical protein